MLHSFTLAVGDSKRLQNALVEDDTAAVGSRVQDTEKQTKLTTSQGYISSRELSKRKGALVYSCSLICKKTKRSKHAVKDDVTTF